MNNEPGENEPGATQLGTNEQGENEPGANQLGANQLGATQLGTNEQDANEQDANETTLSGNVIAQLLITPICQQNQPCYAQVKLSCSFKDKYVHRPINVTLIGPNSILNPQLYKFKFSGDNNFYTLTAASLTNVTSIVERFKGEKYFTYQLTFTKDNNTITKNIPKTISSETATIELDQLKVPKLNLPPLVPPPLGGGKNNRKKYRKSKRKSKRTKKTAKRRR